MIIVETGNSHVIHAANQAVKALKSEASLGKVHEVLIDPTKDAKATLVKICTEFKAVKPNMVIDLTTVGLGADAVSTFTASLGIPTLSARHATAGFIEPWRQLSDDQQGYLVQVRSPLDTIMELIKDFALHAKFTDVGVLYSPDLRLDAHHKKLFFNIPMKYMLSKVSKTDTTTVTYILKKVNKHIKNFFIVGGEALILEVLTVAK